VGFAVESYFVSHFPRFWGFVSRVSVLRRVFNRFFINRITSSEAPRPHPFSLWGPSPPPQACADYISWTGLTDRSYTGRHLPPAPPSYIASLPHPELLRPLLRRTTFRPCPRSTALFAFFAQWFTDSFLRTDPGDTRRNTSNHEIDLCQIYGLGAADTTVLRSRTNGLLKTITVDGQEYPALIADDQGRIKDEFRALSYLTNGDYPEGLIPDFANKSERRRFFFASGLDRGNSTLIYSSLNTIFVREHNRVCRVLTLAYPDWDDNRLFETARNILIVELLQIIIGEYINHLSIAKFQIFADNTFAENCKWYRTNWISAEFDLLYRWHPLAPTAFTIDTKPLGNESFRYNNELIFKYGVENLLEEASKQSAGRISLHNTPAYLLDAEIAALQKSRAWRIASYNEYRKRFGLQPASSFQELTQDPIVAEELRALYGDINSLELTIGLNAEAKLSGVVLGELMMVMVAVDAFSQALTNPLLSRNVYSSECFSTVGLKILSESHDLASVVRRNVRRKDSFISFDRRLCEE
jgi:prostaglandin-endoperoxide synthase 2